MMAAVSPREATRRDIERFVTSDRFHTVKQLGAADVIETSLGEKAAAAGKKVSEVKWPQGCVLVGWMRGLHANVPGPDDVLEPGDILYAMVAPSVRKKFLKLVR
jgi:trk system potassium uptake protein TrkA